MTRVDWQNSLQLNEKGEGKEANDASSVERAEAYWNHDNYGPDEQCLCHAYCWSSSS